jgi:hypothetical protein
MVDEVRAQRQTFSINRAVGVAVQPVGGDARQTLPRLRRNTSCRVMCVQRSTPIKVSLFHIVAPIQSIYLPARQFWTVRMRACGTIATLAGVVPHLCVEMLAVLCMCECASHSLVTTLCKHRAHY